MKFSQGGISALGFIYLSLTNRYSQHARVSILRPEKSGAQFFRLAFVKNQLALHLLRLDDFLQILIRVEKLVNQKPVFGR